MIRPAKVSAVLVVLRSALVSHATWQTCTGTTRRYVAAELLPEAMQTYRNKMINLPCLKKQNIAQLNDAIAEFRDDFASRKRIILPQACGGIVDVRRSNRCGAAARRHILPGWLL